MTTPVAHEVEPDGKRARKQRMPSTRFARGISTAK
jgi:hypothetical protein